MCYYYLFFVVCYLLFAVRLFCFAKTITIDQLLLLLLRPCVLCLVIVDCGCFLSSSRFLCFCFCVVGREETSKYYGYIRVRNKPSITNHHHHPSSPTNKEKREKKVEVKITKNNVSHFKDGSRKSSRILNSFKLQLSSYIASFCIKR